MLSNLILRDKQAGGLGVAERGRRPGDRTGVVVQALRLLVVVLGAAEKLLGVVDQRVHERGLLFRQAAHGTLEVGAYLVDRRLRFAEALGAFERVGARRNVKNECRCGRGQQPFEFITCLPVCDQQSVRALPG